MRFCVANLRVGQQWLGGGVICFVLHMFCRMDSGQLCEVLRWQCLVASARANWMLVCVATGTGAQLGRVVLCDALLFLDASVRAR